MKKILRVIHILVIFLLFYSNAIGQLSDEKWDLMLIREDKVYPSMTDSYEMTLTDLKGFLSSKKVKDFTYFTHMQDDYFFTHMTPINHLKDLTKGIHSFFAKEVNDPELDVILSHLNETIKSYRYYIVQYRPEISYVPEGDNWGENTPYRKWGYYYFHPGSNEDVEGIHSSWKHLYESKGIKTGFRVFSGFIGTEQPLYIISTWAEDPLAYHQNLQETIDLLGEDGALLWSKMMVYLNVADVTEGWFLPQYSYAPGMKLAE
jgi:hypothetical protein